MFLFHKTRSTLPAAMALLLFAMSFNASGQWIRPERARIPGSPGASRPAPSVGDSASPAAQAKRLRGIYRDMDPDAAKIPAVPTPREPPAPSQEPQASRTVVMEDGPLLAPGGEKVFALVIPRRPGAAKDPNPDLAGGEYLTEGEFNFRLNLLRLGARAMNPLVRELQDSQHDRSASQAREILEDWTTNATLVAAASRRGHAVTNREIDETLHKLNEGVPGNAQGTEDQLRGFAIPESYLRAEVRDGLLIEKFIIDIVRQSYDESAYRQVFRKEQAAFLIPPRVRAFHVFQIIDVTTTDKQSDKIRKDMKSLQRILRKRNPDYEKLLDRARETGVNFIGDSGMISADIPIQSMRSSGSMWGGDHAPMSRDFLALLFSLEEGETSDVIKDHNGFHIVRILEREEGSEFSFEAARPQIENLLVEMTKIRVFETVKTAYDIRWSAKGLNRMRRVDWEEYTRISREALLAAPSPSRPLPSDPNASVLDAWRASAPLNR